MIGFSVRLALVIGLSLLGACGGGGTSSGGGSVITPPAPTPVDPVAGSLTLVTGYGSNPGQLNMYVYKPSALTDNRPVVVVLHGCGGRAAEYDVETGWVKWAEAMKFVLIIPEVTTQPSGCFRYYAPEHQLPGTGEPQSIVAMINWAKTKYNADPARIFVTGLSAGGAMTNVMLAAYPDVFAAGAPVAGIPYKCAESSSMINGCIYGASVFTIQQWGDKVRAAHPGYAGPWPRVSIWYGTNDTTVYPVDSVWTMQQWTNVHGEDQIPEISDMVAGYPHKVYGAGAGKVETFEITGLGHSIAIDPGTGAENCGGGGPTADANICSSLYIARWFGLDT